MRLRLYLGFIICIFSLTGKSGALDTAILGPYETRTTLFQARVLPTTADLKEETECGLYTFLKLYKPYSADELLGEERTASLGGSDVAKQAFLKDSFAEEVKALGIPGVFHIRLENPENNSLIGYFSMEDWDVYVAEKPKDVPNHSAYVRQFYIKPEYQKQGIGKIAMSTLLKELVPDAKQFYIATRRINEGAKRLYESLGFKERAETLHGLPADKYVSYELHLGS